MLYRHCAGSQFDGRFNVGDVTGNTIGSLDGSSTIVITATSSTAGTTPVIGILDLSFELKHDFQQRHWKHHDQPRSNRRNRWLPWDLCDHRTVAAGNN